MEGEGDGDGGADADFAREIDLPVISVDDALSNGETQARSKGFGSSTAPIEAFEDVGQFVLTNPNAGILNSNQGIVFLFPKRNRDSFIHGSVFDSVVDKVEKGSA